ncbi:hypothetical protein CCP3SC15_1720001 [Gammaproteobacteria bacterium]
MAFVVYTDTVTVKGNFCAWGYEPGDGWIQIDYVHNLGSGGPTPTPTHTWHDHYTTSVTNYGQCNDRLASVAGVVRAMDIWSYVPEYEYSVVVTETASGNQSWASRGGVAWQHSSWGDYYSPTVKLGPVGSQMYAMPCWPGTGFVLGPVLHVDGAVSRGAGGTGLDELYVMPSPAAGDLPGYDGSAYNSAGPTAGRYLDGAWLSESPATGWVAYYVPAGVSSVLMQARGAGYWQRDYGEQHAFVTSGRDLVLINWGGGSGGALRFYSGALWIGRLSLFSSAQAAPTPADPNATPTVQPTNTPQWGCGGVTCTPVPLQTTPQPTRSLWEGTPGATPGVPGGPAPVSTATPWSLIPPMVPLPLGTPVAGGIDSVDDLVELETREFCYDLNFAFPQEATIVLPGSIAPLPNPFQGTPRQIKFCLTTLNRFSLIGVNLLPGLYMLGASVLVVFMISHLRGR